MKLWEHPDFYAGETYYDYYVLISQHRDSGLMEKSNFDVALKAIQEADDEMGSKEDYRIACASHWAVGWCETLMIHKDAAPSIIATGDDILNAIKDYPVLDDSDLSEKEDEEITSMWEDQWLRAEICERLDIEEVPDMDIPDEAWQLMSELYLEW